MLHPFSARAAANQAHLRIMETTDIHVNVLPYDYYADKPNDTMGLSRTASLIDRRCDSAISKWMWSGMPLAARSTPGCSLRILPIYLYRRTATASDIHGRRYFVLKTM